MTIFYTFHLLIITNSFLTIQPQNFNISAATLLCKRFLDGILRTGPRFLRSTIRGANPNPEAKLITPLWSSHFNFKNTHQLCPSRKGPPTLDFCRTGTKQAETGKHPTKSDVTRVQTINDTNVYVSHS